MRLFLASFLQKENFGHGNVISICRGSKPKDIEVKQQFVHFIPSQELLDQYYSLRDKNDPTAGELFVNGYKVQLEQIIEEIITEANKLNTLPSEVLPFKDGDTLCSWERKQNNNYRKILAPYLEKLGYEVILN